MSDFDSISQKLHSAVRNLAFATNDPSLCASEVRNALYLLSSATMDLQTFQKWALKDSE